MQRKVKAPHHAVFDRVYAKVTDTPSYRYWETTEYYNAMYAGSYISALEEITVWAHIALERAGQWK